MEIFAEESLTLEKYIKELEREEKSWIIGLIIGQVGIYRWMMRPRQ